MSLKKTMGAGGWSVDPINDGIVRAEVDEVTGRVKLSSGDAANAMLGAGLQIDLPSLNVQPRSGYVPSFPNPYSGVGPEIVHPSVVYAPGGFCGYRYWAAYTPYPGANSAYENPCIAISDDLFNWTTRPELQPVVPAPLQGYNADPHLFFSPDFSRLYLVYRRRNPTSGIRLNEVCLMHTTDGVTWSSPAVIVSGSIDTPQDFACQSIWWNGSKWVMLSHNLDAASPRPIQRSVSASADPYGAWGSPTNITVPVATGRSWWHSGFYRTPNGAVVGAIMDNDGTPGAIGNLYLAHSSDDGVSFSIRRPQKTLFPTNYRPNFFCDERNKLKLIRGVGLSSVAIYEVETDGLDVLRTRLIDALIATSAGRIQRDTLVCDNFNRTDSASTLGTSTSGATYTVDSGTWGISGQQAYQTVTTTARALVDCGRIDHIVSATFATVGASSQLWLIGGAIDTANYFRFGYQNGQWQLQCIVAGSAQSVVATGIVLLAGQRASIACYGTRAFALLDGEVVAEVSTTSFTSGTKCGFQGSGADAPTSRLEDFSVIGN